MVDLLSGNKKFDFRGDSILGLESGGYKGDKFYYYTPKIDPIPSTPTPIPVKVTTPKRAGV